MSSQPMRCLFGDSVKKSILFMQRGSASEAMLVHSVVLPPITYDNQVMYRFLHTRINKQRIYNHITCLHLTWMSYDKGVATMFLQITHNDLFSRLEFSGIINSMNYMKHLKQYSLTKVEVNNILF